MAESIRDLHERGVGDAFISWFNAQHGTSYSFAQRGGDPPDVLYRDGSKTLPLEITTAYYDAADARARWKIARHDPDAPTGWSGFDANTKLIENIRSIIVDKCLGQHDPGTLLVISIYPAVTTAEEVDTLLEGISISARNPFDGIFLIGNFGISSSGGRSGYQVWKFG